MRHRVAGRKLGRDVGQRKALSRALITELFRHERISTTEAKAKFMRAEAEHLITMAKRGLEPDGNGVHARRLAARVITDPDVTKRLFDEVAPRFADRPGGYTRLVKVGPRFGDGAQIAVLELVERSAGEKPKEEKAKSKGKTPKAPTKGKEEQAKGAAGKGKPPKAPAKAKEEKPKGTDTKGKAAKAPEKRPEKGKG